MASKPLYTVTVPRREGFAGYWCAGRFFEHGSQDVELTVEELAAIREDQALGLPIGASEAPTEADPAPAPAPAKGKGK